MYYAVIHRPEAAITGIEQVGQKYDPSYNVVGPHVTLLFPISEQHIAEEVVKSRFLSVAGTTESFPVRLNSLELSWDQWLFLTPTDGRVEFDELHDRLYEGPLAPFLRHDIPFVPHVALGHFAVAGSNY